MTFTHITLDIADQIATLTLNRPEARNALSDPMRRDLDDALKLLRSRAGDDIKALILTGAGGAFAQEVMSSRCMNAAAPEPHLPRAKACANLITA